ncbi:MAG: butyryl-CoA:acetate CoA-transferase [Firmicutes bacterium]|nr:butyryl-CoA:acetate CoA-transferase [Bacillota bacterium]
MEMYRSKLVSAEEAVKVVKSGDFVRYGYSFTKPTALDMELAKRKDELYEVNIGCATCPMKFYTVEADPTTTHFRYNSGHMTAPERYLHDKGLAYYAPSAFGQAPDWYRMGYSKSDVVMIAVCPMDKHGYFNFGPQATYIKAICEMARTVIVEINPSMPRALGGFEEAIHISEVDMIVEDPRADVPLPDIKNPPPTPEDTKIAELIVEEIPDGACIQLGIGAMPAAIGEMIAQSDLKDLGIHSEQLCEAMMNMYLAGKVTGRRKALLPGKITYTFSMGSKRFWEWIDDNPVLANCPVYFTNYPQYIMANDNFISINNTLEVDLTGQACSESKGTRMISGSGGQLEFAYGSFFSKGGKSFLAMTSTYERKGVRASRIVPTLTPGAVVTTPRPIVHYLVTEYGKVILKGKSNWQRAELLISIAHPDFRDDLVKEAEKLGIWRRTAKIE